VYKRLGRITEARAQFESSAKLKANSRDMWSQWVRMEIGEKEWSKAIAVADRALKAVPEFYEMLELKIYAKRQAGFDFHRGMHREKAQRMWREAVEDGTRGIKSPEALGQGERHTNASILRSIVISLDMLGQSAERDRWLHRWAKEHPDDPEVERQRDFLAQKHRKLLAAT
jgi:hypothetical protein